jgi:hypothetical protein
MLEGDAYQTRHALACFRVAEGGERMRRPRMLPASPDLECRGDSLEKPAAQRTVARLVSPPFSGRATRLCRF